MAKNNKIKYSYGNDIELCLWDKKQKRMVSAITVLKRDKHDPISLGDGINLYHDNLLAEVSFPPYYSKKEMFKRFKTVFSRIQKHIGNNYKIVPKASHVYDDKELQDPKALEAGCSVNYNAYTVNCNPPTKFEGGLRSSGFHCHVGGAKYLMDFQSRIDTIKLMDIFVGVANVIVDKDKTTKERRKLYGAASEHRPTNFGLEYRPLSPGILRSKKATELTFDLINHTLKQVEQGNTKKILESVDSKMVIEAINNCDRKLSKKILEKVGMPQNLMKRINAKYKFDFYKSWKLKSKAK